MKTIEFLNAIIDQFHCYYGERPILGYVPDEAFARQLAKEASDSCPLFQDDSEIPGQSRFVFMGVPFEVNSNLKSGQVALCKDWLTSQIYLDALLYQTL